jgi:chromosome partitioning protein
MNGNHQDSGPRVIAIVNQKGGVGKTTTAVNLGASLALLGKRVLLVDSDPQGNTTTGVGIDKRTIEGRDVYSVLLDRVPLPEVIQSTGVENLWIAPSTLGLSGAEIELVSVLQREVRLKSALAEVVANYEYVFIDCPPSLGLLTVNALAAAHELIIPVQAEYYALEGLSQLTTIVEQVRSGLNPQLSILGVLITMFDGRTRLATEVLDEVHRFFPERVFRTQIPRNIRLSEAPSFGKPAALFDPKSRGAQAYISLAREMIDGIGTVETVV